VPNTNSPTVIPTTAENTASPTTAPEVNVSPTAAPVQPTQGTPVDANGVPLVAKVNGTEITQPDFEQALARRQLELNAADPAALRAEVLDQLIEDVVIQQGAAAQNITVSDADVQAELQNNIQLAGSDQAWQEWLTANGYTPDEFLKSLRVTLITNR